MQLMVTTAAKKYIFLNGRSASAKLVLGKNPAPSEIGRPKAWLGEPNEAEANEYKEIDIGNDIKIYVHITLLNLDDTFNPRIDVGWKLTGRGLVIKNI